MNSIFVTGAGGYIGSNFLRRLNLQNYETAYCLVRNIDNVPQDLMRVKNIEFVQGNINDADSFMQVLSDASTVVHFAALTGKARPDDYFSVNRDGTKKLVSCCLKYGVRNFLYISSISVKYPDISAYYYARSKLEGEQIVRESGLRYAIARPTIVIGKSSALLESMLRLIHGRSAVVFGNGKPEMQPIHVDDLNDCIISILENDLFRNEIYELGGKDIISINDFIIKLYSSRFGSRPVLLHVPLAPLIFILRLLEKVAYDYLPINTGQLSVFRFNSTIQSNSVFIDRCAHMKNIDEIVGSSIR